VELLPSQYVVLRPTGPFGLPVGHSVGFAGHADGTLLRYFPAAPLGAPARLDAGGGHRLASSRPVGIQVLGYGNATSYQYPGEPLLPNAGQ
jgi:hypothetical protein